MPITPPVEQELAPPLVSVLVRSMGRPSLADALRTVAAQTYPAVEIVIVNASGAVHPPLATELTPSIRLVSPGRALARAAAANAALDAARGEWLMFLDDDDLIDPDHVARLVDALAAAPAYRVAYAGVRLTHADGRTAGVLDERFESQRLWLANFLPIHGVMFARSLLQEGHRFDETMEVYEDWDFWQQLAQQHAFLHVPGVSATYRLVGESGLSTEAHEAASARNRQRFYRKWMPRVSAQTWERVARYAEVRRGRLQAIEGEVEGLRHSLELHTSEALQAREQAQQLAQALHGAHRLAEQAQASGQQHLHERHAAEADAAAQRRQLDELRTRLQGTEQALQRAEHTLQAERERAAEQAQGVSERLHAAQSRIDELDAQLTQARRVYADLEAGYRALQASLSWRATAPLRAVRAFDPSQALRRAVRALPVSGPTRHRIKMWLVARPWAHSALRWLAPASVPTPPAAPPPPASNDDKQRVRAEAEAALTAFLNGTARVDLGFHAAQPQVSVIVVMFNQAGLTHLCLQALAASEGVRFETLLVDNGSTDRVPQLLQRVDGATVLRPGSNLGFLRAVNRAAEQATAPYLLLLNNDAMVEPQTLARAVARLQAEPDAGAVGGPILLWNGQLQEAGSIVWRDGSCLGYGRNDSPELPSYRYVRDVDYCSGAFLLLRRELFERLGRFDDAFAPAYYEESDFCVRLWEHGHRIVYDPAVRVRHFEFASEVASGQAIELQRKHRELFVAKHPAFLLARPQPDVSRIVHARQRLRQGAQRILVIDDRVPLPWLGQGYPRAAALIRALARKGHAVTHYPLQFPQEDWADIARALPETVEVMINHGLTGIDRFLDERRELYDTVIVSRPHNMGMLRTAMQADPRRLAGARIVYDAEAMFSLRDIAKAEVLGQPVPAADQQQMIDAELALAEGADAVLAVSEAEATHYRRGGYDNVQVLGHAMQAVRDTPDFDARDGFLFLGALTADDTPNSDSVLWFVREVWPRVVSALGPRAQLHVVGECTAPAVLSLSVTGVHIHGRVDDVAHWLDRARVFVVPTRYAAGIPHKAHEAAARGLPMVVTPLIAGQLKWGDDLVAIGADAAAFADACVSLHADGQRWERMRGRLLNAAAAECSPAAFERAIHEAIGSASRAPAEILQN